MQKSLSIPELYEKFLEHHQVQTDTRQLQPGDMFFALSGPNFNGNHFALQALEQGAAYAVTDEDIAPGNDRILKVGNVLETLQLLAQHHRRQFSIPFIAVTGSNGKTTTKELIHAVLSSHYTTYTTHGNLNNHIGIPVTLLRIKKDAEMAVIEMGANHQGEIAGYCTYTQPTHGIITNCGKAHLEGFGGIEGVRKGKGELFDYLKTHDGTAFIFHDLDYLVKMSEGIPVIHWYGTADAAVTGKALGNKTFLEVQVLDTEHPAIIPTQLVGDYNLPNVLCAISVGKAFSVPYNKIIAALSHYTPTNSRSQMVIRGSNHIILDAYNANPTSLKLAIDNIASIESNHKILVIGGMMELGNDSFAEHQAIVDHIRLYNWDKVVLVGGDFKHTVHPYLFFPNALEAKEWFNQSGIENSYILIKGSRSMKMESILS